MLFAVETENVGWAAFALSILGNLGLWVKGYLSDKSKIKRDEFEQLYDQQGQTIKALEVSLERVRTNCEKELAQHVSDKTAALIRAERAETWIIVLKEALERHGIQVSGVPGPGSGIHKSLPPGGEA